MPGILAAVAVALVVLRLGTLRRFWKLPLAQGPGWFWTSEVEPGFHAGAGAVLLRRYRQWLVAPLLLDAIIVSILLLTHRGRYAFQEQLVGILVAAIVYRTAAIQSATRTRLLLGTNAAPGPRTVQVALEVRRLRDHTVWWVEGVLFAVGLGAVAAAALRPETGRQTWEALRGIAPADAAQEQARRMAWALCWLAYIQLGLLLLKRAFAGVRMKLPMRRADDYVRWRSAWLRYHLRILDAMRLTFALVLGVMAACVAFDVARPWAHWPAPAAVGVAIVLLTVYGRRERAALAAVERDVRPVELTREFPAAAVPDGHFAPGGWAYFNRDNPALFVRSRTGIALNLANRGTYYWAAYLAGLVILAIR